jgi:hypothetical protein
MSHCTLQFMVPKVLTNIIEVCSNGWRGCCTHDVCTIGYCAIDNQCPTGEFYTSDECATDAITKREPEEECQPGQFYVGDQCVSEDDQCPTGQTYQVCSNGWVGCCASDVCSIGYCVVEEECAAGEVYRDNQCVPEDQCPTGQFYQVCSNGLEGCYDGEDCGLVATTQRREVPALNLPRPARPMGPSGESTESDNAQVSGKEHGWGGKGATDGANGLDLRPQVASTGQDNVKPSGQPHFDGHHGSDRHDRQNPATHKTTKSKGGHKGGKASGHGARLGGAVGPAKHA